MLTDNLTDVLLFTQKGKGDIIRKNVERGK